MSHDPHEMVGRMRVLLEEALKALPKGVSYRGLKKRIDTTLNDSESLTSSPATLAEKVRTVVPYVTATLSPDNTFPGSKPEWREVHAGRIASSVQQLEALLDAAGGARLRGHTADLVIYDEVQDFRES